MMQDLAHVEMIRVCAWDGDECGGLRICETALPNVPGELQLPLVRRTKSFRGAFEREKPELLLAVDEMIPYRLFKVAFGQRSHGDGHRVPTLLGTTTDGEAADSRMMALT